MLLYFDLIFIYYSSNLTSESANRWHKCVYRVVPTGCIAQSCDRLNARHSWWAKANFEAVGFWEAASGHNAAWWQGQHIFWKSSIFSKRQSLMPTAVMLTLQITFLKHAFAHHTPTANFHTTYIYENLSTHCIKSPLIYHKKTNTRITYERGALARHAPSSTRVKCLKAHWPRWPGGTAESMWTNGSDWLIDWSPATVYSPSLSLLPHRLLPSSLESPSSIFGANVSKLDGDMYITPCIKMHRRLRQQEVKSEMFHLVFSFHLNRPDEYGFVFLVWTGAASLWKWRTATMCCPRWRFE